MPRESTPAQIVPSLEGLGSLRDPLASASPLGWNCYVSHKSAGRIMPPPGVIQAESWQLNADSYRLANGSNAMFRACLMASASRRWCGVQTPVRRRGTILPASATNCESSRTSL